MGQHEHHHGHGHGHVEFTEDDWARLAAHAEREGEIFIGFVAEAAAWAAAERGAGAPPVRRVLDIGSGPGVGTCELAQRFPDAEVIAVDGSPAMLERATARAAALGLADRVRTHHGELPGALADFAGSADLVWASQSLHHVGDEVAALREMGTCLRGGGVVAIAEFGDPMRLLPAVITFGNPGLEERLQAASQSWFAAMREGLPGAVPSQDLTVMVAAAGLEVVGEHLSSVRFVPPLTAPVRAFATDVVRGMRDRLATHLDSDDAAVVDALLDPEHEQSIERRADVFLETSRRMLLARRPG